MHPLVICPLGFSKRPIRSKIAVLASRKNAAAMVADGSLPVGATVTVSERRRLRQSTCLVEYCALSIRCEPTMRPLAQTDHPHLVGGDGRSGRACARPVPHLSRHGICFFVALPLRPLGPNGFCKNLLKRPKDPLKDPLIPGVRYKPLPCSAAAPPRTKVATVKICPLGPNSFRKNLPQKTLYASPDREGFSWGPL